MDASSFMEANVFVVLAVAVRPVGDAHFSCTLQHPVSMVLWAILGGKDLRGSEGGPMTQRKTR